MSPEEPSLAATLGGTKGHPVDACCSSVSARGPLLAEEANAAFEGFLHEFLPSRVFYVPTTSELTKDSLLERVHESYKASSQPSVCTLVYQGAADPRDGSWCFEGQQILTFSELQHVWLNVWRTHSSQHLVLLLDAPGASHWVQRLRSLPDSEQQELNMCIQACTAAATHEPGAFLEAFMEFNRCRQPLPASLRPCFYSTQTPQALNQLGSRLVFVDDTEACTAGHEQEASQGVEHTAGAAYIENSAAVSGSSLQDGLQCYNSISAADPAQHKLQHFHQDLYDSLERERAHQDRQPQPVESDGQQRLLPSFLIEQGAPKTPTPSESSGLFATAPSESSLLAKAGKCSDPVEIQLAPRQLHRGSGSRLSRMTSWVDSELLSAINGLRASQANLAAADFEAASPRGSLPRPSVGEGSLLKHVPSSTFSEFGDVPATNLQRPRRFEVAGEDSSGFLFKDDAERYAQLRALRQEDRFAAYYDSDASGPGSEELAAVHANSTEPKLDDTSQEQAETLI